MANETRGLNRKYLRLQDLRRLQRLSFSGRRRVEGIYSGRHATPQRGQSVEFRDYREYHPGDEISGIDWRVYGRTDKLFIRQFEHQSELTLNLLIDASASMSYRGLPASNRAVLTKFDYACQLGAALGFLTIKQHDRVACGFAQDGLYVHTRAGGALPHLLEILQQMEEITPAEDAKLADTIKEMAAATTRKDILVVISDLLEDRDEILKALSLLRHRGNEAIIFHVLHGEEIKLPAVESGVFIDSESLDRVQVRIPEIREAYAARIQEFLTGWQRACRGQGMEYHLFNMSEPYFTGLERFLTMRSNIRTTGGRP